MGILTRILGDPNAREIKRVQPIVQKINDLEQEITKLSDAKLKDQTKLLRERIEKGESLDKLLPEAFATVREAAKRSIGQRHFDEQMIGGIVLHEGKIAEMRTGEGKTLVATAPVYLNALRGKGVHVVTVNDYLASLHGAWMGQVYYSLGLITGVIVHEQAFVYDAEFKNEAHDDPRMQTLRPVSRQEAYRADITYGTNNEFGFDYLRDNMVDDVSRMVQRDLNYAIVDEVDSILIDEARTPLIISAPAEESTDKYLRFAEIARRLKPEEHYTVDEKLKAVSLTDEGIAQIERVLEVDNIYEAGRIDDVHHIEQSLKAEALFKRDRDYVSREGEIVIVDEFTGRLMFGRRYSEGLHQAIEAKEGVQIRNESLTLATITFQNYFRLYEKLAGMTGTAATEAEEFGKIYELEVTTIPTHRPMVRQDLPDRIYKSELGKFRAVATEVQARHAKGQPVLLGTVSIEKNELLSSILDQLKVPHQVLNAKNNEAEAAIIASAGQKGQVTLATNIAGRGTDIMLGEEVSDLGGLHVIGTERHESRRIDNQLRGRSGRQGDPGSSQFYVSLEDDLMRIFGGERIAGLMNSLGLDEDTPIENSIITRSIESAQKKVEGHNFDIRKQLVEYDDVMNKHRTAVYIRRRKALENANLRPEIQGFIEREIRAAVGAHTDVRLGTVETKPLIEAVNGIMPLSNELTTQVEQAHPDEIADLLVEASKQLYNQRIEQFGEEPMRLMERLIYLRVVDNLWIEHLEAMDSVRSGIGLRAIGQRDPLVEYKSESYRMYKNLIAVMEAEIASTIFRASIGPMEIAEAPVETALTKAAKEAATNAPSDEPVKTRAKSAKPTAEGGKKVGRNNLCPCGSGLKYKKCGMINSPKHRV
jgi:preprotein translocase subunit SecA